MMRRILIIALAGILVTSGMALAVPYGKSSQKNAPPDQIRGMHFGGVYPQVDTMWPGVTTVHPWVDNKTYPSPENVTEWAYGACANCLFFTPYYGPLYGALGANNTNIAPADSYLDDLANTLEGRGMSIVIMVLPTGNYYPMFGNTVENVASHLGQLSLGHPNLIVEFDEPDWGGGTPISETTFTQWVSSVKSANPDCFVTVGLDYYRGTPAIDKKWWSHCDGVTLIDYWAYSASSLRTRVTTWVNAVDPKPCWTFIPTGDVGNQVGGVNLNAQQTKDYLDVAITYSSGSFVFDRGGM